VVLVPHQSRSHHCEVTVSDSHSALSPSGLWYAGITHLRLTTNSTRVSVPNSTRISLLQREAGQPPLIIRLWRHTRDVVNATDDDC